MKHRSMRRSAQKGFTLMEIMIAMALISVISLVMLSPLGYWMDYSQRMETDNRLQDIRSALERYYETNAMAIDSASVVAPTQLGVFTTNVPAPGNRCPDQVASFQAIAPLLRDTPDKVALDGHKNPWCFSVTAPIAVSRDGTTLSYRNIAIISTGKNGILDAGTSVSAAGVVTLDPAGDDKAIMLSGLDIQYKKLTETLQRMQKIANSYELYFTTRYLANASRDMTIYYFNNLVDTAGTVASTNGVFTRVNTQLAPLGVSGVDGLSAWEASSDIELGNYNESINGVTVRSPATTGSGVFPYTAILRARVPNPSSTTYAHKVVMGNY